MSAYAVYCPYCNKQRSHNPNKPCKGCTNKARRESAWHSHQYNHYQQRQQSPESGLDDYNLTEAQTKIIAKLRHMTTANGCTPEEADNAQKKITAILKSAGAKPSTDPTVGTDSTDNYQPWYERYSNDQAREAEKKVREEDAQRARNWDWVGADKQAREAADRARKEREAYVSRMAQEAREAEERAKAQHRAEEEFFAQQAREEDTREARREQAAYEALKATLAREAAARAEQLREKREKVAANGRYTDLQLVGFGTGIILIPLGIIALIIGIYQTPLDHPIPVIKPTIEIITKSIPPIVPQPKPTIKLVSPKIEEPDVVVIKPIPITPTPTPKTHQKIAEPRLSARVPGSSHILLPQPYGSYTYHQNEREIYAKYAAMVAKLEGNSVPYTIQHSKLYWMPFNRLAAMLQQEFDISPMVLYQIVESGLRERWPTHSQAEAAACARMMRRFKAEQAKKIP